MARLVDRHLVAPKLSMIDDNQASDAKDAGTSDGGSAPQTDFNVVQCCTSGLKAL